MPLASLTLALALAFGEPGLDVSWSAPDPCPGVDAVQRAIEDNLAREEFGDALDAVRVSGEVSEHPDGWHLSVSVTLPQGSVERELNAASCDVLAPAAGLIIAVALDPLRVQEVQQERTKPAPEPPTPGLPRAWVDPARPSHALRQPPSPKPRHRPSHHRWATRSASVQWPATDRSP